MDSCQFDLENSVVCRALRVPVVMPRVTTLVCVVLQVVQQRQFATCVVAKLYTQPVSKYAYNVSNNVVLLLS